MWVRPDRAWLEPIGRARAGLSRGQPAWLGEAGGRVGRIRAWEALLSVFERDLGGLRGFYEVW